MLNIKITGLNELKNNLKDLESKVQALEGTHKVSLKDLFNQQFLEKYTKFFSVEDMFTRSGFKINSEEDLKAIPDGEWDKFISANTNFNSWKEMLNTAAGELTKRELFG